MQVKNYYVYVHINMVMPIINLAFSWYVKLVFLVKLVQDSHDFPETVGEGSHVSHHSSLAVCRAIGAQQHQEVLVVRDGLHCKLPEETKTKNIILRGGGGGGGQCSLMPRHSTLGTRLGSV